MNVKICRTLNGVPRRARAGVAVRVRGAGAVARALPRVRHVGLARARARLAPRPLLASGKRLNRQGSPTVQRKTAPAGRTRCSPTTPCAILCWAADYKKINTRYEYDTPPAAAIT